MKRLPILALALFVSACASTPADNVSQNAAPSEKIAMEAPMMDALQPGGISEFVFSNWAGPEIPVWAFVPEGVDISEAPVMMMMHGAGRGALRYLKEWQTVAQANGVIVIAPKFAKDAFPGSANYNSGRVFDRETGQLNDEAVWTFSAIEPLFDHVVSELNSQQKEYTLYGHSAGSQFVHRFRYYKPQARVKRILAANAGWYTFPDLEIKYPYGLGGANVPDGALKTILKTDIVILLGDQDIDAAHRSLRRTPEALEQGPHRYARGLSFYEAGEAQAKALDVEFGWKKSVVPGVAHSNGGIAKQAIDFVE